LENTGTQTSIILKLVLNEKVGGGGEAAEFGHFVKASNERRMFVNMATDLEVLFNECHPVVMLN
jgi:hypothetical protein